MPDQARTSIALNRFGLGARPGEDPPNDPAAWLKSQFDDFEPLPIAIAKLGDPQARLAETMDTLRALREAGRQQESKQEERREMLREARDRYLEAVNARAEAALTSSAPFVERLVHFWSNHFAVSMDKAAAIPFIPIYESMAIRPHVLGRFEEMLFAVERHPAMLLYLDQAQSIGPDSMLAQFAERRQAKRTVGLNENLSREILELHTLGARSGYTQALSTDKATKLDATFALHPALAETAGMYGKGDALFVHAVASSFRDRSHFDAQNILETGGKAPYAQKDGWLNRLAAMLPNAPAAPIAFASTVPAALRGPAEVNSYAPSNLPDASDDLYARVAMLYEQDAQLHKLWTAAMEARNMADGAGNGRDAASLGKLAATFLAQDDGPRIAMLESSGWDTHNQQAGRLNRQFAGLDATLAAIRDGLGDVWRKTTILVATEFGRTVVANGTGGTDHGTATAAIVAGGAVRGGRVVADWPGLAAANLYENRDLRPTLAIDGLISGVAGEALGIEPELILRTLFADTDTQKAMSGFIRR